MNRFSSCSLTAALATFSLAAWTISVAAQAAPVIKTCKPAPTGVVLKHATPASSGTISETYKLIPQAIVNFTQGGPRPGCVIVMFSALGGSHGEMAIRAVIDGVVGLPKDQRWSIDDDEDGDGLFLRSRTVSFLFPTVQPGARVLRVQYRSMSGPSDLARVETFNVVVNYVP